MFSALRRRVDIYIHEARNRSFYTLWLCSAVLTHTIKTLPPSCGHADLEENSFYLDENVGHVLAFLNNHTRAATNHF